MQELVPLTGAILNFLLVIFVATRGLGAPAVRVYCLLGLCISIWNFGTYFLFIVDNEIEALYWARFLQFGVIFIPVLLFHLSLLLAQLPVGRYIYFIYGFQTVLASTNFTDFFISGVRYAGYAYYSEAGPGFWLYTLPFGLTIVSVIILIRRMRQMPAMHRKRLYNLAIAQGALVILGGNDMLPILGFYQYPGTELTVYPVGSMAAVVYGVMVGYSVFQYQLLDIHLTLGRVAAHLVRLAFVFLMGLCFLLVLSAIFHDEFNPVSFFSALGVLMVSSIIASNLFPRLFGTGGDVLERRILGDKFEYHDKIQDFIQSIPWYSDTNLLIADFHELLVHTIGVQYYQILLVDETSRALTVFRAHPGPPQVGMPDFQTGTPIFELFREGRADYLLVNASYAMPNESELTRAARDQIKPLNPEICLPFKSDEDPFGLLLVGLKSSGEPYTANDIQLLTLLAKNLSLIINQLRLKLQVMQAEELELLGRMSRGMAHDLNNLLTPVSTFLQLCELDGAHGASGDLLPVVLRNVKTMQAYIQDSLFFSQHNTPNFQHSRLDPLLEKAVEFAETRLKRKRATVSIDAPSEIMVEMDEVLIQRLIGNLLANAIDASPAEGSIRMELYRLAKTESQRDWVRLRIIDFGEGINRENLQRIQAPYFTTKDHGDESRGFGLGLSICRKIIHLHGGHLNIFSEVRKGTTVQVDLPSHQLQRTSAPKTVTG